MLRLSLRRSHRAGVGVFIVTAAFIVGCSGGGGRSAPPPDTTAPVVSVNPLPGNVSRAVSITATASDNVGVTQVEFRVDGTAIGTDTSAPFSVSWNTGTVNDSTHALTAVARDAAGNTTTSAPVSVVVANQQEFDVTLTAREEPRVTPSAGTASSTLTINLATGATSGAITVTGLIATAAHIHDGFAGVNGPVVVGLGQDSADATRWVVPAGATLPAGAVDRLVAGALYLNVHSAQFPEGEIRGQILPEGFQLFFADLSGVEEIPEVSTEAGGRAAVTLNRASRIVSIHINTVGADGFTDANAAHLHRGLAGTNGPVAAALAQDSNLASHWFVDGATLAQTDVDALVAAQTYVNVHTSAHADGEIRGQVVPDDHTVIVTRLTGEQEAPQPRVTAARGSAAITVTPSGAAEVRLSVTGADDAVMAHIHDGFAGSNGPVLIALEKDASDPTRWRSNSATLSSVQREALAGGGFYANVHTPAAPAGAVRGQLVPKGVELVISHMTGAQEAPDPVATSASARASTTVNTAAKRLTVHVNTTGLDDATMARVHRGARGVAGPVAIGLTQDPNALSHWSAAAVDLTDEQLADYRAGGFYVNVHTPANQAGEARGQIELGGVAPFLYADIQGRIFNATCATSGCHAGAGAPLGLNLEAAVSHDNLVDVASVEVASLLRVAPGDAPASYLARKLDGGPGIVGVRMPNGRPPLPQTQIDRIKAWINAGALPAPVPPADTQAPTVTLGSVPATITGTVTLTATATDDVGVTLVRFRVNGSVVGSDAAAPYAFDWNSTSVADGAVTIDAQALDAAGNVGTSSLSSATVSNPTGPAAFTFTEIQTQIFNSSCALSGCHSGGTPAAGMNLDAPAYSRIVGVASSEVPSLQRINPGNAADSYMIRKLEGGPGIVGARMPLGGPFLPQATIDRIRAWIDSGAPNN